VRKFGLADHFVCDATKWTFGRLTDHERYLLEEEAELRQQRQLERQRRRDDATNALQKQSHGGGRAARRKLAKRKELELAAQSARGTPPTLPRRLISNDTKRDIDSSSSTSSPAQMATTITTVDGRTDFGEVVYRGLQLRNAMVAYIGNVIAGHLLIDDHRTLLISQPLCLSSTSLPSLSGDSPTDIVAPLPRDVIGLLGEYLFGE
jgi:hypothetical protein